jgi:hypothetical protein
VGGGEGLDEQERGPHVDRQGVVDDLGGQLLEVLVPGGGVVGDQDVERAHGGDRRVDQPRGRGGVGQVEVEVAGRAGLRPLARLEAVGEHPHPGGLEPPHRRKTDPVRVADPRDERGAQSPSSRPYSSR